MRGVLQPPPVGCCYFLAEGNMFVKRDAARLQCALRRFRAEEGGNIAIIFGLVTISVLTAVGAALDSSRASSAKTVIQMALDAALLAGARDGTSNWVNVATNVFTSNLAAKNLTVPTPSFLAAANSTFTASAS